MRHVSKAERRPTRMIHQRDVEPSAHVFDDLETLERRLEDGYARIEYARTRGQDVAAWEEFWIELLHQYESAVDHYPAAA